MSGRAVILAGVATLAGKFGTNLLAGFTAVDGSPATDIATQAGIAGAFVAAGIYFLRRGDSREKELALANKQNLEVIATQAQADLKAMRDEMALMRADYLAARDHLIRSLAENGTLNAKIADMTAELTRLRILHERSDGA